MEIFPNLGEDPLNNTEYTKHTK